MKLPCASDPQKAVWLSLDLGDVVETSTHLFSVHGFLLTNAIQLFPTQTSKTSCEFPLACCRVSEGQLSNSPRLAGELVSQRVRLFSVAH